jgi:hypothetical protein
MESTELVDLIGVIRELVPAQQVSEYTAEAWEPLLLPWDFADAKAAVYAVKAAGTRFIDPGEIIAEIKRIRAARVAAGPVFNPAAYPEVEDNPDAERAARRDHADRVGSGLPPRPVPDRPVSHRPVGELLARVAAARSFTAGKGEDQ